MPGRVPLALLAAFFVCWQSGCVSWQAGLALLAPTAPPSGFMPAEMPPDSSDLARMKPGDYADFEVLPKPSEGENPRRRTTEIAGRIVAIDATEMVLTDCLRMEVAEQVLPRGPLAGVPGLNRLTTSTGIVITPKPTPGEIRVPTSSIARASLIPSQEWPRFQQPRELVRR